MVAVLPFIPSSNNYRLIVPFDSVPTLIDTRWNARDAAWYIDFREEDETLILGGIKIVLGVNLGRRSTHSFFLNNLFLAFDTSGQGLDAGYDDLGARVVVQRITIADITGQTA